MARAGPRGGIAVSEHPVDALKECLSLLGLPDLEPEAEAHLRMITDAELPCCPVCDRPWPLPPPPPPRDSKERRP